ncbi:hypothetical protein QTI66_37825 [Variovorax sp. J22R133]|nr:hypothetical protein [Variovorax sp. J22R133]MDM0117857.1 hypothetical protein [Variovorax sp. J22R133]
MLDIDANVKPLYEWQEGAELGLQPHKRGRSSHVPYTMDWR